MNAINEVTDDQLAMAKALMRQKLIPLNEALELVLSGEEPTKPHKYHAVKTEIDGVRFDSKAEANYYCQLKQLERAGAIRELTLQPTFPLLVNGTKIGVYRADFSFVEVATGRRHVQDVKGVKTPIYRRSVKHVEAQYGITVEEVAA